MHFLYQNGQMGVVLEIFVNGYPTWVKTPLWELRLDTCQNAVANRCLVVMTAVRNRFAKDTSAVRQ